MTTRTPQTIAAHLRHISAPATRTAETQLDPTNPRLHLRIIGAAELLDHIDLHAIADNLTEQRHQAQQGRPRNGGSGRGSGGITNTTADIATEMYRIREYGLELQIAIDAIHPDPAWPANRCSTGTEALARCCAEAFTTSRPDWALDNLIDAVANLADQTRRILAAAKAASGARAWYDRPPGRDVTPDIDPPDPLLEAARCTGWPLGKDKHGDPIGCPNWRTDHRDANGVTHHDDTCLDCYRLICPHCWSRVRRSPGASECDTCHTRRRRAVQRWLVEAG